MLSHYLITAIVSKVSIQNNTHFLIEYDLQITELFSLNDEFDGLRTATRLHEVVQSIQANLDNEHGDQSMLIADSDIGCENSPADINSSSQSQAVPPSQAGQQSTLSQAIITAYPAFTFTFPSPSVSNTGPQPTLLAGQKKGGRCSVCAKALCPRRHECYGSVNRAWCRHGHAPLQANEKIRWSEAEIERRIAADKQTRVQVSNNDTT